MSSAKKTAVPFLAMIAVAGTLVASAAVLFIGGFAPAIVAGAAPADAPSNTLGVGLRVASFDIAPEDVVKGKIVVEDTPSPDSLLKVQERAQAPLPKPKPKAKPTPKPAPKRAQSAAAAPAPSRAAESGSWQSAVASWYGPGFYGRRTASGAVLTQSMMNVAHLTLPFGTKIEFEFNGRTVTAVVNDRGPHIAGRVFDLGPGTAKALGFGGVQTVRYRILGR